jgi:SAM-dependent MidA family methyltransferase
MHFSDYMEAWLYGEEGYYKKFHTIGKSGDFYTAVSTSRFFGASIANYLYRAIEQGDIPSDGWLIEIGAHQGYLLCDMIQWLYTCDASLVSSMKFGIVERQPEVREVQKAYIQERFGDDVEVVHFHDVSEVKVPYAFFVANEILDAFPCELYKEGKIATVSQHTIAWQEESEVHQAFAQHHHLQTGEIAVGYETFATRMAEGIERCDFVTFDYGEKYVRNDFSVRIYREHETLPLFDEALVLKEAFGKCDITYDVNFTHASDAFQEAGFQEIVYETQARALVRFGLVEILEKFAKSVESKTYTREVDKIKTLLSPTMMGDRFKMIHFAK